jgi:hypothetical protein
MVAIFLINAGQSKMRYRSAFVVRKNLPQGSNPIGGLDATISCRAPQRHDRAASASPTTAVYPARISARGLQALAISHVMKSTPGPPMTLDNAAAARVRLIVWCRACRRQVEPDPAEQAQRYGAEMPVLEWRERLVCSQCGGRQVDMVVTGTER